MIGRRTFIGSVAWGLFAAPLTAFSQRSPVMPKVGLLLTGSAPRRGQSNILLEAFWSGMRELGYIEGQNIQSEVRWSEGEDEHLPALALDLVRLNVDVIITQGAVALRAAKAATDTIPIVMGYAGDPIGLKVATSLARPGANVTGLSLLDEDLDGKRIEILKEVVPNLQRIAILWSENDPGMTLSFKRVDAATRSRGLTLQSLALRSPEEIPGVFNVARSGRAQALIVTAQVFTNRNLNQIVALAAKHRLFAMYTLRSFVDAGGLMSYGPNVSDLYRRSATYVDKILRGASPQNLPIELPTKFELIVNMRTATALGLRIPQSVLLQADAVIQ